MTKGTKIYLYVLSLTHAIVDASCAFLVVNFIDTVGQALFYVLLYNLLAFGTQFIFGYISDRANTYLIPTILGCIMVTISLFIPHFALIAIILAGIGNSLFHIGGGGMVLQMLPRKTMPAGIFVAPGGIGLAVGALLSYNHLIVSKVFVFIIAIMIFMLLMLPKPLLSKGKTNHKIDVSIIAVTFVLIVIVFRSLVGVSIDFTWKTGTTFIITFAGAIAFGKVFGGLVADKFGIIRAGVLSLMLASVLLYFGSQSYLPGILGIFLFSFSMPITLRIISDSFYAYPGFSFGIASLALLLGALPGFMPIKHYFSNEIVISFLGLISALLIFSVRLRKFQKV